MCKTCVQSLQRVSLLTPMCALLWTLKEQSSAAAFDIDWRGHWGGIAGVLRGHGGGIVGALSAREVGTCVAVCCHVLLCVAVCCRVLQCVAVRCSVLQCTAVYWGALHCVELIEGGLSARDAGGERAGALYTLNRVCVTPKRALNTLKRALHSMCVRVD